MVSEVWAFAGVTGVRRLRSAVAASGVWLEGQSVDLWSGLQQCAQISAFLQLARMWPYSWQLLHRIGSWMSFKTVIIWPCTDTLSLRRQLADLASAQVTFSVATCWFRDRLSGLLIQLAEVMAPLLRLQLVSMLAICLASLGLKSPVQGTNFMISGKFLGLIEADSPKRAASRKTWEEGNRHC
jgi:hypothetical protein